MVIRARAPREDVADAIRRHGAPGLRAPRNEEVAHLLVGVGEGEPPQAAGLAWADFARAHDGRPEPRSIDRGCRGHGRAPFLPPTPRPVNRVRADCGSPPTESVYHGDALQTSGANDATIRSRDAKRP